MTKIGIKAVKITYRYFCWECFRSEISVDESAPPACRRCGGKMELVAACAVDGASADNLVRKEVTYEAARRYRTRHRAAAYA